MKEIECDEKNRNYCKECGTLMGVDYRMLPLCPKCGGRVGKKGKRNG